MNKKISVVIPIHNEGPFIYEYVEEFIRRLGIRVSAVLEILLVENGSQDNSLSECKRLEKKFPGVVRALPIAIASYGEAIKTGILEANGEITSILECDFLKEDFLMESAKLVDSRISHFVVASKRHPESHDERPLKRRILTYLFNTFLKYTLGFGGTETHGLKTFHSKLAKAITKKSVTSAEVFQSELVLLANRFGIEVKELPIQIKEKRATPFPILKRVPKVINILSELKKSLNRFPKNRMPEEIKEAIEVEVSTTVGVSENA